MGNLGVCERAQTKSRRVGNFVWMKAWSQFFLQNSGEAAPSFGSDQIHNYISLLNVIVIVAIAKMQVLVNRIFLLN